MTTIATDGKSMAGDGRCQDHFNTLVDDAKIKVFRLADGRIVGGSGNSFDVDAWRLWLTNDKLGDCPIHDNQFAALILRPDGTVLWVDHKGRETLTPTPCAIGSGQDYAYGVMDAGLSPERAAQIASGRDTNTGGKITVMHILDSGHHDAIAAIVDACAVEPPLRMYDIANDRFRPVTQDDVDRLLRTEQAFGKIVMAVRGIVPRG